MISNDCGRPFPIRQRYVKKNAKPPDARQIPVVLFAIRKRIPEKYPDSAQKNILIKRAIRLFFKIAVP
jgi:hypothetical protein